jgi:hypothetical protein
VSQLRAWATGWLDRLVREGGPTGPGAARNTSPGARAPQQISIPPVVTEHVRVVILSGEPGSPAGTQPPTDKVAISEVSVS